MKAFAIEAQIRSPDGRVQPFRGGLGGVFLRDDGLYQCDFTSTAISGGGMLYGAFPEWVCSQAAAFIRYDLGYRHLMLVDERGSDMEFTAPLTDARGNGLFPDASFTGRIVHADGRAESFTALVQSPVPSEVGFDCAVSCSLYENLSPARSTWPEQAYELAFGLLRHLLLADGAMLTHGDGRPLSLIPPVG